MAEGKKAFLIYCDILHSIDHLTTEEKGLLFQHLLEYVNDMNPVLTDRLLITAWKPIETQLKRDLKKWDKQHKQRIEAGRRSAELRKRNSTVVNARQQASTVNVSGNVSVNGNVNDINKRKDGFKKSLSPFLDKYGSNFLNDFYLYWTEHNEKGKKMRFEYAKNQPFNIERRLATWLKNQKRFEKEKSGAKKEKKSAAQIIQEEYGIR